MHVHHQIIESDLLQPLGHRLDCRALLGNEEHSLPASDQGRHEVSDRLRFAPFLEGPE